MRYAQGDSFRETVEVVGDAGRDEVIQRMTEDLGYKLLKMASAAGVWVLQFEKRIWS